MAERITTHPHERHFAEEWDRQMETHPDLVNMICGRALTPKERHAVASVIQWLGSNVGHGFLTQALLKSGYSLHGSPPLLRYHGDYSDPLLDALSKAQAHAQWMEDFDAGAKKAAQLLFDLCEPN